ncbi:MAG: ABC transporter permease [Puniceicoccales bacterium]|jgi:putative ABC transport system permease protein|nr:ABC transporter permease [Puniceicoccales bacterium]
MSTLEALNCLEIGLIYGIMAMGIFLTFRMIDFPDMTCDGSFVLGGAISGIMIKSGCNPWVALCVSIFGGALAGLATGILHTLFKISNLLSGILTAFMLYSINIRIMGGLPNISLIGESTIFPSGTSLWILLLICFVVELKFMWLLSTDFGLGIRSVGQSKITASNYGINVPIITTIVLMLSNASISLSGALLTHHQYFVDISQGIGALVMGLAAVMIGEKLFPSRSCFLLMPACIIGSIVYRILTAFALHSEIFGLETHDLNLLTGLLIIFTIALPKIRKKLC